MTIRVLPLESFNQSKHKAIRMFELKPGGWYEEVQMLVGSYGYVSPKPVMTYSADGCRFSERKTYLPLGDLFVEIEND